MGNLCIIPARGGSKRIPRKNIKDFLGKPVIAYSIQAALTSQLFQEVIVSTDDDEIANIAMQFGAAVPFKRSAKNADDFATTLDVIREVCFQCEERGEVFSNICCIYPTAPFVTAEKLKDAYEIFTSGNFDSVVPIMKYSYPIQRSFVKEKSGLIRYQFLEFQNHRSQDLMESYHDAGQFYWMKSSVTNSGSIITTNTGAIEIDNLEGQDIDNETDWILAEAKYSMITKI